MSNLYLYEQGITIGYKSNRLIITDANQNISETIPIEHIDNVIIFGGIQISTVCMQNLLKRGIHLTILSKNGSYYGRLESTNNVNINRQRMQFRKSDNKEFCLKLAKQFITGKASNQRTIISRYNRANKSEYVTDILKEMSLYIRKIEDCKTIEELMGIEGYIARLYYSALSSYMKDEFKFTKRSKRPPKDPFNALISFGYTLLHYEIFTTIMSKGLNPYAAFLHSDKHKHAALCSDIMEEFRPILVDSLAVALINTNRIKIDDFEFNKDDGGVYLKKEGCKTFVNAFEKRMREEVGYIVDVSYKMSFRRIIEYQIMELIKMLEKDGYLYKPVLIR